MFFQQIIDRINEEREAQDLRWGKSHDNSNNVTDWVAYTRRQIRKANQLHNRKLIVVGAMAVACIEAADRRFKSVRPRSVIYSSVKKAIQEHAFVTPHHTYHREVIDDLLSHLDYCESWDDLVGSMRQILAKVMRYLTLDQPYTMVNNTHITANPHFQITCNKTGKVFTILAGSDRPQITITFNSVDSAIELLMSIPHLDIVQR